MPYSKFPSNRGNQSAAPKNAGSRSPKHRGYKPEADAAAAPKKKRWNADERASRAERPATDARPNWEPRGKDTRPAGDNRPRREFTNDRPQRAAYGDRPARPAYGDRPQRNYSDRPARDDRAPRTERPAYGDRPARPAYDDRPARPAYGDRPQRSYDDRPARPAYGDRPQRDDRAPRREYGTDRPQRSYSDRPARDNRAPRTERPSYGDRPARTERPSYGDRPARTERPSYGDRPARTERPSYSDRPARSYNDRPQRTYDDRPQRSSDFYPDRTSAPVVDDVVLEKLVASAVEATDTEGVSFGDLGLGQNIVRALAELGAASPFPIQAATIPAVLTGKDVLGRGRTGSGKTIAFGAPLVERLLENGGGAKRQMGRKPRAIILAPTRELALQIDRTVQPIARSVGLFTTQIYGGVPQARQVGALQRGVDIIVGTPGRVEDLVRQGRLDLSEITITVLDEADHMCDLGFLEPVQRIIRETSEGGQKLLFSATLDSGVATLVDEFLVEPAVYEVAGEDQASSTIDHRVLLIEQRDKRELVRELAGGAGKTLVFTRTRAFAEELSEYLEDSGIGSVSLHGDLNQARRTRNLERLTSGRVSVLVATDVAARGIHVDDISLVIQADAPEEYKTYLHRAGRTGRAGKLGTVVTLVNRNRRRKVDELLGRAEITAKFDEVRPGDELVEQLAAL